MPSYALYMTSYPHFMTTILSIYEITCTVFMTSPALYMIWYIYFVWYHIHYMCDITQCLYLWHHTLYVYDISILCGIIHSVMTLQPLYNFKATMSDMTPTVSVSSHPVDQFVKTSVCMTSQPLHVWHHMHYTWHHIHSLGHHTTLCMTSSPL